MQRRIGHSAVFAGLVLLGSFILNPLPASAQRNVCNALPSQDQLKTALTTANQLIVLTLNNQMWATIVAADGTVCAVAHTGDDTLQSQWLASRVISAQKANTANSLSLGNNDGGANPGLALSSANLWAAVQPGGSLFGLQFSNPVDPAVAYKGPTRNFGTRNDPMVGQLIGGINVFGGGLALYDASGDRVGGVGVSGDTSCRDHMVAWETRHNLGLDFVTDGVSGDPQRPDNIIFDVGDAFGHPNCLNPAGETTRRPLSLPSPSPIGDKGRPEARAALPLRSAAGNYDR